MVNKDIVKKYRMEILNSDNAIRDILIEMHKDTALNNSVSRIIIKSLPDIIEDSGSVIKVTISLALELMSWEKAVREEENAKKALSDANNEFIEKAMKQTEEEKRVMSLENFKQSIMLIAENYTESKEEKDLLNKILIKIK